MNSKFAMLSLLLRHWDPVFFTNSSKVLHSITQNPYSPNPMHYLQLNFLDSSVWALG
ncbi:MULTISPECIES: hypothetical protein [unclassified Wolbachia]|uniref:hypothetical protein n=1 Tax=unclassified Wolbachia TaxID=2640676 RepID=UPI000AA12276|nr:MULTISPECIES: hypothetical protein [unclassified Wolbachia]